MKKANAFISAVILVLFCVHGIGNALQMVSLGSLLPQVLSFAMLALVVAHALIGVILTLCTLREQRRAGTAYLRLNKRFWAVRASGAALILLIAFHVCVFGSTAGPDDPVRLAFFGQLELAAHLLLVAALAVHVLCNLEPLLIDLGLPAPRGRAADAVVVFAVLLAAMAVAFVVYYLRWAAL